MTVSTIGVADAAVVDKYLHTNQRTISSTAREDQYVLPGQSANATYSVSVGDTSVGTTDDHVIQIMGDGSNYSRIERIDLFGSTVTTKNNLVLALYRLSSAGTGGTSVTPAPFDTADTYAGGAMTLPSSKGTEGTRLLTVVIHLDVQSAGRSGDWTWTTPIGSKPIIFGPATSSGVALKVIAGRAGGYIDANVIFTTTTYL